MVKFRQVFLIEFKHTIRVKVLNAWDWVRCALDNVSWGGGKGRGGSLEYGLIKRTSYKLQTNPYPYYSKHCQRHNRPEG